jgi:hypothetical protein
MNVGELYILKGVMVIWQNLANFGEVKQSLENWEFLSNRRNSVEEISIKELSPIAR